MRRPCACFFCSGEKWLSDSDCAALLNSTCQGSHEFSCHCLQHIHALPACNTRGPSLHR